MNNKRRLGLAGLLFGGAMSLLSPNISYAENISEADNPRNELFEKRKEDVKYKTQFEESQRKKRFLDKKQEDLAIGDKGKYKSEWEKQGVAYSLNTIKENVEESWKSYLEHDVELY
ncbi:hypothetical protein DRN69_03155, partial [Candidatus Pacearchaeota archaeon]